VSVAAHRAGFTLPAGPANADAWFQRQGAAMLRAPSNAEKVRFLANRIGYTPIKVSVLLKETFALLLLVHLTEPEKHRPTQNVVPKLDAPILPYAHAVP